MAIGGRKLGLILPGGGFHGPFQAGVLKFFEERNVKYDYIVASSIGIINASILGAKGGNAGCLCDFWRNVRGRHFFHPAWKEWIKNRRIDSLCTHKALEKQILKIVDIYDQRTDLDVEISILNLDSGRVEYISNHAPDFKDALWAGTAIAPIWPAVFLPGRGSQYVDGGLGRNFMIQRCFAVGCEEVVLINLIETQKTRAKVIESYGEERGLRGVFWRTATLVIKRVFADSAGQDKYDNEKVLKIFSPSGTYFSTLFPSSRWFKKMIDVGYAEARRVFAASSFLSRI
jgi:predicted acylesterase/phospholipase RssA